MRSHRREMTLQEVMEWPVVDPVTGLENNIYNERGARIPRQVAWRRASSPTFAGLLNVKDLQELFVAEAAPENEVDATQGYTGITTDYFAYPQAGLQRYGHFQAHGMINPIKPFLKDMNDLLRVQPDPQPDDDADDESLFLPET